MSTYIPWKWAVGPNGAIARKEPLAWQRLESHSRNSDFTNGIQAPIHDPLWMLTRQWQLGEFEGEDSGSPVYVKIENRANKITKILSDNDKEVNYNDNIPLETFVERSSLEVKTQNKTGSYITQLDLQIRVRLGLQFQREIEELLKNIIDQETMRKFIKYLARDADLKFELNEHQVKFEVELTKKFVSVVKGRVIDVSRIFGLDAISILKDKTTQYFIDNPTPNTDPDLHAKVIASLEIAINNLTNWWNGNGDTPDSEQSFFERPPNDFNLWKPEQLEYSFKVKITPDQSSENLILEAAEYKEDHLDWYSFTVSESTQSFQLPLVKSERLPISTNLIFSGMPEKRWWDFDEGYVDFGTINLKKNNIVSILLMEFGLVHSSDWYIIPHPMEVGSINKIEKFTVMDCFGDGDENIINPAGSSETELHMQQMDDTWDAWSMFSLSEKYRDRDEKHNTSYFFLPPTLDNTLQGGALEETKLLRDETSNLVWAVEKSYRTYYGEPISGYDHYFSLQNNASKVSPSDDIEENLDKKFKYTIMTGVPWNWIPFIPVHKNGISPNALEDNTHKHIKLQRGSMINPIDGSPIQPNSRIISEVNPYYIDESEIPRTGISVSEKCQRTVWYNGNDFLWIGRKKSIGTGEGSSGLQFDSIPLEKK